MAKDVELEAILGEVLNGFAGLESRLARIESQLEALRAPQPDAMSLADAARALSVGVTTVKKLLREGQLRSVMVAGRRVVPRSEINRLLTPVEPKRRQAKRRVETSWQDEAAKLEAVIAAKRRSPGRRARAAAAMSEAEKIRTELRKR